MKHHAKDFRMLREIENGNMKAVPETRSKQEKFNHLLLKFVIDTAQYLNVVDKSSFRDLINALDNNLSIMGSKKLGDKIELLYLEKKEKLIQQLRNVKRIVVTADVWSSYRR